MQNANPVVQREKVRELHDRAVTRRTTTMARYRAKHRRFDYIPCPGALEAINRHRELHVALAGVIDKLIVAGDRAISGKNGGAA
jgi:hypothetical protein